MKGRKILTSLGSSAHMMECRAQVLEKYPDAKLGSSDGRSFVLKNGAQTLTNPHPSHYECWVEAAEILREFNEPTGA